MKKNCNKRNFNRIPMVSSITITLLYQKFARRSISRHAKLPTPVDSDDVVLDKRHNNPDQPRTFMGRDKQSLVRAITTLCNIHGLTFTARKIKNEAGLHHIVLRTVRQYINKSDYYFRQLRRKGQVTAKDFANYLC